MLAGKPTPPNFLVISAPSIVPTVRFTFLTGNSIFTGSAFSSAFLASSINLLSNAFSRPCSCVVVFLRSAESVGASSNGARSKPAAFQCSTAFLVSNNSTWPTASAKVLNPSCASSSRTSWAIYSKKVSTNSGLPVNFFRSSGF